jgi:hypothetical protein
MAWRPDYSGIAQSGDLAADGFDCQPENVGDILPAAWQFKGCQIGL